VAGGNGDQKASLRSLARDRDGDVPKENPFGPTHAVDGHVTFLVDQHADSEGVGKRRARFHDRL
jgi:hypothetical protein